MADDNPAYFEDYPHHLSLEWVSYGDGNVGDMYQRAGRSGGRGGRIIRRTTEVALTEEQRKDLIEELKQMGDE